MRNTVLIFLMIACVALVGCTIDSRLREDIAKTAPNFDTFAAASIGHPELTAEEEDARKELEAKLKAFFEKAGAVK